MKISKKLAISKSIIATLNPNSIGSNSNKNITSTDSNCPNCYTNTY
jgi:hypothetical protein